MVCGRAFSEEYGDELNKVVLNEEAVRLLGFPSNEAALGRQLAMEVVEEPLQVIGVVRNYHQQSLAVPYKPIIFFIKERVPVYRDTLYLHPYGRYSRCSAFGGDPSKPTGISSRLRCSLISILMISTGPV